MALVSDYAAFTDDQIAKLSTTQIGLLDNSKVNDLSVGGLEKWSKSQANALVNNTTAYSLLDTAHKSIIDMITST